jgi:2-methylcitrate dehydratase
VRLHDGTTLEHEVQDYPGMPSRPFTWNDAVEKFDQLTADRIDSDLAYEIKDAVHSLEQIKVRDLMAPLARIHVDRRAEEEP